MKPQQICLPADVKQIMFSQFFIFGLSGITLNEFSYGKQCEGLEETKLSLFCDASPEVFVNRHLAGAGRE